MKHKLPNQDFPAYHRFIGRVFCFIAIFLFVMAPLIFIYIWKLRSVGEFIFARKISRLSFQKEPLLWHSKYYTDGVLKDEIAFHLSPELAILGSSHVIQFRSKMFARLDTKNFYNLSQGCRTMVGAKINLKKLLHCKSKPKLIILGLDWVWFQLKEPRCQFLEYLLEQSRFMRYVRQRIYGAQIRCEFLLDQLQLLQRAWRDPQFYQALASSDAYESGEKRKLFGLDARRVGGFRNDGSFYYRKYIQEASVHASTEEEIKQVGFDLFAQGIYQGNIVDKIALKDLQDFIKKCKENNIALILFLPPINREVFNRFTEMPSASKFWKAFPIVIKQICQQHQIPLYDFTDPGSIKSSTLDFIDWHHGSELVAARILAQMILGDPSKKLLSSYVDSNRLSEDIKHAKSPYVLYNN